MRLFLSAVSLALSVLGCAASPNARHPEIASTSGITLVETGSIVNARDVRIDDNKSAPLSPVIGALLGGVAGSMIGSGSGRAIATVGGAAGGSIAAQEVTRAGSTHLTRITVRLDDGREATYDTAPEEAFRIGERVQITSHAGKPKIVRLTSSIQ
jgi:outer membrane lipoprotein SlyB